MQEPPRQGEAEAPTAGRLLDHLDRLLGQLSDLCLIIAGTFLVVLAVIFGWLVFGRYVLNATPTWVEQAALLLVAGITFLGAAVGIHERGHLSVAFFRNVAPRPLRIAMDVLADVMVGAFGLVMMVESFRLALFKWSTQIPLIHLPEGLRTVPIVICGGLLLVFSINHLLRLALGRTGTGD